MPQEKYLLRRQHMLRQHYYDGFNAGVRLRKVPTSYAGRRGGIVPLVRDIPSKKKIWKVR